MCVCVCGMSHTDQVTSYMSLSESVGLVCIRHEFMNQCDGPLGVDRLHDLSPRCTTVVPVSL